LFDRIDRRIDEMIAHGLKEEVAALLGRGYFADLPSLSAIGYQQMIAHLKGELSIEETAAKMRQLTHQFVRRQANWFKLNDPKIQWFQMDDSDAVIDQMEAYIRSDEGWRAVESP
jgi:tRNA dimethylallyltransferase